MTEDGHCSDHVIVGTKAGDCLFLDAQHDGQVMLCFPAHRSAHHCIALCGSSNSPLVQLTFADTENNRSPVSIWLLTHFAFRAGACVLRIALKQPAGRKMRHLCDQHVPTKYIRDRRSG